MVPFGSLCLIVDGLGLLVMVLDTLLRDLLLAFLLALTAFVGVIIGIGSYVSGKK